MRDLFDLEEEQEDTSSNGQLFEVEEHWEEHWKNMPEFVQENKEPIQSIIIHFSSHKNRDDFAKLISQKITYKTKSLHFPKVEQENLKRFRYE